MKKFLYLAAVILLCSNYLFGQTDKKEYIQQWVDSLNSRNPDVWIEFSSTQFATLLTMSKDSLDWAFTQLSEKMLVQEKEVLEVKAQNAAQNKFHDTYVKPAMAKRKTQEDHDNIVRLYPEFFSLEERARVGVTEEMAAQKEKEHIQMMREKTKPD